MKKIGFILLLTFLSLSAFAQWQVEESYDSGNPYLKGSVQSNDKNATLFLIPYEDNVAMSMQTSHSFASEIVEVKLTFVVNGARKSHEFLGMTNKKGQILLFQIEHISSPFVGGFLRDFKSATGLTVSVDDEGKTRKYVFGMTGSTKAYNSVLTQENAFGTTAKPKNTTSQHLSFKGHSISGNAKNFSNALQKDGFTMMNGEQDVLKGKFDGRDVTLALITTPRTETMCGVLVEFATFRTWKGITEQFSKLENDLSKKYGNPTGKLRDFISPYEEGDGYEMDAVYRGKCNYATYFEMEIGTIAITITKSPQDGNAAILLAYYDKEGRTLMQKEEAMSGSEL